MKVGPPKGVRHVTGQADAVEDGPTSPRRPVRMAGEAKKRLELYHESRALAHFVADIYKCQLDPLP